MGTEVRKKAVGDLQSVLEVKHLERPSAAMLTKPQPIWETLCTTPPRLSMRRPIRQQSHEVVEGRCERRGQRSVTRGRIVAPPHLGVR